MGQGRREKASEANAKNSFLSLLQDCTSATRRQYFTYIARKQEGLRSDLSVNPNSPSLPYLLKLLDQGLMLEDSLHNFRKSQLKSKKSEAEVDTKLLNNCFIKNKLYEDIQ